LIVIPIFSVVQDVPSEEVLTVPSTPTAANRLVPSFRLLPKATSLRALVVPEVLEVHVVPSDEVRTVPLSHTTTNVLFP